MSTTSIGRAAKTHAARYLQHHGFIILDRNWRKRRCELDIVASPCTAVHCIEAKYRATTAYGPPSGYINNDKISHLTRAALARNQAHHNVGD